MVDIIARDYQEAAGDALFKYFETHPTGNPVIVMPTGTGKSIVIAKFIHKVVSLWAGQRIMMLTHVKELIEQNADKLQTVWPFAPMGIYSAGLGKKEAHYPITFAGIQSVRKQASLIGHVDLIMIDECHLVPNNSNTSYRVFLDAMKEINPKLRVIGFSATPYRLGLGMITEGEVFDAVCFDLSTMNAFHWLIDQGYLIPPVPYRTQFQIDTTKVKKRGGEFIDKQLQEAVDKHSITEALILESIDAFEKHNRQYIMVFATGVDHVDHIVDFLLELGEDAVGAHSKMGKQADINKAAFGDRKHKWIVSNGMLTTGVDYPHVDGMVIARPTSSAGMWVQILGRGTRPCFVDGFDLSTQEGRIASIGESHKQNTLVLDFAGNTMRLGPINDVKIPKQRGKKTGELPIKICPKCDAYNHPSVRFCDGIDCDHEFEFKVKIQKLSAQEELLAKHEPPIVEWFSVDKITYDIHKKHGGAGYPSLKVTYHCGLRRFKEYVPLWHPNAKEIGKKWWLKRSLVAVPLTTDDALTKLSKLVTPERITVHVNTKYPKVMNYEFNGTLAL